MRSRLNHSFLSCAAPGVRANAQLDRGRDGPTPSRLAPDRHARDCRRKPGRSQHCHAEVDHVDGDCQQLLAHHHEQPRERPLWDPVDLQTDPQPDSSEPLLFSSTCLYVYLPCADRWPYVRRAKTTAKIPRGERLRHLFPHRRLLLSPLCQPGDRHPASVHAHRFTTDERETSAADSHPRTFVRTQPASFSSVRKHPAEVPQTNRYEHAAHTPRSPRCCKTWPTSRPTRKRRT